MSRSTWVSVFAFTLSASLAAQGTRDDYARAAEFLPWNVTRLVKNLTVEAHWLGRPDLPELLWYARETATGREYVLVDPARNVVRPAFDHARLAQSLGLLSGRSYQPDSLRVDTLALAGAGLAGGSDGTARWRCDLREYRCARVEARPARSPAESVSPDGRLIASAREHDLYVRDAATGKETRLTTDGENYNGYGDGPDELSAVSSPLSRRPRPIEVLWSPDSRKLLTYRLDQRRVGEFHLIQWSPPRPETSSGFRVAGSASGRPRLDAPDGAACRDRCGDWCLDADRGTRHRVHGADRARAGLVAARQPGPLDHR